MDVVKNRIEGIGGSVAVRSRVGEGSTIRLTIPVTRANVPATSRARSAR
jgi:chemotaxis protein histidine kinase CheA